MSSEAESQIDEARRQAILDHFGDYLRQYIEDHPDLDDLGKKQIRDALVLIVQENEITDGAITFGRAVVLAEMLGINTLYKAFMPHLSLKEVERIIREGVLSTVNETATWIAGREPKNTKRLSPDNYKEKLTQLVNNDLLYVVSVPYVYHIDTTSKPGRPKRGVFPI